jgi:hypothetical protein
MLDIRRLQRHIHARRDSNPQQAVLETATLPIELLAYLLCRFLLILVFLESYSKAESEEEVQEDR